jgi:hypothetical protein
MAVPVPGQARDWLSVADYWVMASSGEKRGGAPRISRVFKSTSVLPEPAVLCIEARGKRTFLSGRFARPGMGNLGFLVWCGLSSRARSVSRSDCLRTTMPLLPLLLLGTQEAV